MHNKYTNDDVDTMHLHLDGRVAYHNMHWACTRIFPQFVDDHTHTSWLKSWALSHSSMVINRAHSPWLASPLSTSSSSSCPSPFSSSTSSCSLSSSTRRAWHSCAAPLQKRVRTPWTSSTAPQIMSPSSLPSTSSTTHQFPSPSWSLVWI